MSSFFAKTLRNIALGLAAAAMPLLAASDDTESHFGRGLSQEIGFASSLSGEGPLRHEYRLRGVLNEPFWSIDSLGERHWLRDWIAAYGEIAISNLYFEGEMGMKFRPLGPIELGASYSALLFPYSTASFAVDSLEETWTERELSRRMNHDNDPGYIQIATCWLGLKTLWGRTLAEAHLAAMAVDVSEDSYSAVYHFRFDLPLKRGNKITEWLLRMEYAFGTGPRERSWTLGSTTRVLGLNTHWVPWYDFRPSSDEIAHVKSILWAGIPLPARLRLHAGFFYATHSFGGGEKLLDDNLGAQFRLIWNWGVNDYSVSDF